MGSNDLSEAPKQESSGAVNLATEKPEWILSDEECLDLLDFLQSR